MQCRRLTWIAGALIALAPIAWTSAGCAPECATDDECGASAICVNGQCKQQPAPASDAATPSDAAAPDRSATDAGWRDASMSTDRRSGDLTSTDQRRVDSAAVDQAISDRAASDHAAGDHAAGDHAVSDAAGSDANSYRGQVGAPCQGSGECTTPIGAYCDLSMPGGYCTASCTYGGSPFECGDHAECYCIFNDGSGCAEAQCFRTCWFYNECRDGYVCETADWLGFAGDEDLCYRQ